MENPFAPKFDICTPCTGEVVINKCYENDPRFFTVKFPHEQEAFIFQKNSAIVNCQPDACADTPCANHQRTLPQTPSVIITGTGKYESQWANPLSKWEHKQAQILPGSVNIVGEDSNPNFDDLCTILNYIVTDCSCECK